MKWPTVAALVFSSAMTLWAGPLAGQVREQKPNLIGGELLGRGIVLTANYERYFTNQLGIGGGLMAIGASGGFVGILPLYASVLVGDEHALYVGAGTSIVFGDGSIDDDFESEALGNVSVGYQFQSYGGFFVRPLFTVLFDSDHWIVWPGITIGGSF